MVGGELKKVEMVPDVHLAEGQHLVEVVVGVAPQKERLVLLLV